MRTTRWTIEAILAYCANYFRPKWLWSVPVARTRRGGVLAAALEPLEPRVLLSITSLGAAGDLGTSTAEMTSRIAAAANGHYVVAWESTSGSSTLEFALFDGTGAAILAHTVVGDTVGTPVVVQNSSGSAAAGVAVPFEAANRHAFDVAMDAAGEFVIVWQGSGGIFAQQFGADGATSGAMLTVSTGTGTASTPAVAMDAAGDFAVTWIQDSAVQVNVLAMTPKSTHQEYDTTTARVVTVTDASNSQYIAATTYTTGVVKARRFSAAGAAADAIAVSAPLPASTASKTDKSFSTNESPAIAMDAAGDFVVGWEQAAYVPMKVQTAAATHYTEPYTSYDANNNPHVHNLVSDTGAQFSYTMSPASVSVLFQRYSAGTPAATPTAAGGIVVMSTRKDTAASLVNGGSVAVAMDSAGDFAVADAFAYVKTTVKSTTSGSNTYTSSYYQSASAVTVRRYSRTGAAAGSEVTVAKSTFTPHMQASIPEPLLSNVAAAMDPTGDLVVAWNQDAYDATNGANPLGIFAQRYDAAGKASEKTPVQLALDDGTAATMPAVAFGGGTTLDVTFSDSDIFAERYYATSASQLKFTLAPKALTAGVAGTVVVAVDDSAGKVVAAENGTITLTVATGPDISASFTAPAVNGVATFSNLTLTDAGTYTLLGAYGTLTATSAKITLNAGTASQMVFLQQPSMVVTNVAMVPAVTVELLDSYNNVATGDKSKVTLTLQNFTTGISGNVVSVSRGIAAFKALKVALPGTMTLAAADSGAAVAGIASGAFVVTPLQLKILKQPTTLTAGSANTTALVVQVADATGKAVGNSSTVTLTVATGPGAGTQFTALTSTAGTATFSNIILDGAGTCTLTATDGTIFAATSKAITVKNGAAVQLGFVQQPGNFAAGSNTPSAVTVAVEDAFGNLVATANASVTLIIGAGQANATLSGTLTATTIHGVASFGHWTLSTAGTYSLAATAVGLSVGSSNTFTIL